MTMLMMWLGRSSVALATDSKMTGTTDKVTKLHRFKSDKIMFGIGFGPGAFDWLIKCPCDKDGGHPYPEHWRDCSNAQNLSELERIMRNDLRDRNFPSTSSLELWLAGFNEHGILEAFVLDGTGQRVQELMPGDVIFNGTAILSVSNQTRGTATKLNQRFHAVKKDLGDKQIAFSGAKALEEVGREVIEICEQSNNLHIGGPLNYHKISKK